jgi:beta-phosphoglucomutase-like phosphatase (HAD superfamily)/dTDP-glucose pyrophosphorylase
MNSSGFGPNRLIIFDLDGVLIDSRDIHFQALNYALNQFGSSFEISRADHLKKFDGLNTRSKLELLSVSRGLPRDLHDDIWRLKQQKTQSLLDSVVPDEELIELFKLIKSNEIHIAVASNSIGETVKLLLENLGLVDYVDLYVGNEDVKLSKPFPETYWRCMIEFESIPSHTVIFEDSQIGRRGASESGGHLIPVRNRYDLNKQRILSAIKYINGMEGRFDNEVWASEELNVLIPMAGAGSRFSDAGFTFPKPLIEVKGMPMIQAVVQNLNLKARFIFIVQEKDYSKYNLFFLLNLIAPGCEIVQVSGLTEGAACTTLLAKEFIDSEKSLLIANSDQIIDWNPSETMYALETTDIDGAILTFNSIHPKWSYARVDQDGDVIEVAEKKPISDLATVGIYYWRRGSDYVRYAEQMINTDERVNGEFYVCPVYNYAIKDSRRIITKSVDRMWGIGTPEDLEIYLRESTT